MDPIANLKEQRELAADILVIQDNCSDDGDFDEQQTIDLIEAAQRLAELVQALDQWQLGGGWSPYTHAKS